jgi:serine O-acetyltransferase
MFNIVDSSVPQLLDYVDRQLQTFFPDQKNDMRPLMAKHIDLALARLQHCINAVRMWREDEFDYLHSSQYAIFLYYLSNTIWKNEGHRSVCNKMFYLNKTLNGIDCFYEIEMPEIFFIGHSVGIVLAKAQYGNYLVLYQNSTVGKNHGRAPTLGEGVVIYPNSAIIGGCNVADGSVIAQGVGIIDKDTPGNCLCFRGEKGQLLFKETTHDYRSEYFRV